MIFKKPLFIVGAVGIGITLAFSFTTSSSMTVNGEVVQSSFRDYPSIAGGGIAAVCGLLLVPGTIRRRARWDIVVALGLALLGALRLVTGLGLL